MDQGEYGQESRAILKTILKLLSAMAWNPRLVGSAVDLHPWAQAQVGQHHTRTAIRNSTKQAKNNEISFSWKTKTNREHSKSEGAPSPRARKRRRNFTFPYGICFLFFVVFNLLHLLIFIISLHKNIFAVCAQPEGGNLKNINSKPTHFCCCERARMQSYFTLYVNSERASESREKQTKYEFECVAQSSLGLVELLVWLIIIPQ